MDRPVLHIGNKRYSSWSLRVWLVLRKAGIEFDEALVPLYTPQTRQAVSDLSPGGSVPALTTQHGTFWDSLAIAEWAAEREPGLWPDHEGQRALARAAVCRMHAGFTALRGQCGMDIGRTPQAIALNAGTRADIAAIQALWNDVGSVDGPWLFGRWSIADAFFTPVAVRFHTFDIPLHAGAQDYCDKLLADEDYAAWRSAALAETLPGPTG
ncbi:glutathione S-transferase family protein [Maricaulis sp.]|uniref:glutathione S-transferase family protein n=1 Tax=Maricaulis sp. TaxID=1486257 RepID=UPI003299D56C